MTISSEFEKAPKVLAKLPPLSEGIVPEPLLDADRASAILGIHPKTLQRMARRGEIRGIHIGKLWRFRASVIEEWIAQKMAS